MIDERKEEAAALYALDLLEGAERASFEGELARDPALQKFVDQFRAASTDLALTAQPAEPSSALRQRVLASIAAAPGPAPVPSKKSSAEVVSFAVPTWISWAAAACFALAAAYLTTRYLALRSETVILRESEAIARLDAQSARQQLEAERIVSGRRIADLQQASDIAQLKIARLASLAGNSPEAIAIAVWSPERQEGVLNVEKLPPLRNDQDYQLWVVDPKKPDPVNGGVFTVDAKGTAQIRFHPDQPVSAATQFAVSRERKGGVPKAQGPLVLAGSL
jgi:anti-sigma-K factor RskA